MVLAVLFVALPVLVFARQQHNAGDRGHQHRDSANLMIFEERLAELDAELTAGALDADQHQALKAELQRTLLADVRNDEQPGGHQNATSASLLTPSRLIPVVTVVLMLPLSFYLYGLWGFEEDLQIADVFESKIM